MTAALHAYICGEAFLLLHFCVSSTRECGSAMFCCKNRYSSKLTSDSTSPKHTHTHIGMHWSSSVWHVPYWPNRGVRECSAVFSLFWLAQLLALARACSCNECMHARIRHTFLFLNFSQCMFVQSSSFTFTKLHWSRARVVNMGRMLWWSRAALFIAFR